MICVDPWYEPAVAPDRNNVLETIQRWNIPRNFFEVFMRNMVREGVWEKVIPVIGKSGDVHGKVPDADLVYIDGDHSYEGQKLDNFLYGPKAQKVICGDDYAERPEWGVIPAVDEDFPDRKINFPFWYFEK